MRGAACPSPNTEVARALRARASGSRSSRDAASKMRSESGPTISATPASIRLHPPIPGQDTDAVFTELDERNEGNAA